MARKPDPILALLEAERAADRELHAAAGTDKPREQYDSKTHTRALRKWRRAYARLGAERPTTGEGAAAMLRVAAWYVSYELADSPAPRLMRNVARYLNRGMRQSVTMPDQHGVLLPQERRERGRARALKIWATRRARYGEKGHRGAHQAKEGVTIRARSL